MNLPCKVNLDRFAAQSFIDTAIRKYGISREYNDETLTVHCADKTGTKFDIVQFHSDERTVYITYSQ